MALFLISCKCLDTPRRTHVSPPFWISLPLRHHTALSGFPCAIWQVHVSSCLFYILCVNLLVAQSCLTICETMDCSPSGSSAHGDSPGKNTGVGCHALLQGIFLTQESNSHLLHWQADSLPAEPPGKPLLKSTEQQPTCFLVECNFLQSFI